MLRISEIYESIQGEGEFTGTSSVFVRTTGCNLRCWFCDTPYTSWTPEGFEQSIESVVSEVESFRSQHVVITGGEPLLQPEITRLTDQLRTRGYFVTMETAGTIFRPVLVDLMSISPKLANSTPTPEQSKHWASRHELLRNRPRVIRRLIEGGGYQFKFVIDRPEDIVEVTNWLEDFPEIDRSRVWLMPQAVTQQELSGKSEWLQAAAEQTDLKFTSRLHIEKYGNVRGR